MVVAGLRVLLDTYHRCHDHIQGFIHGEDEAERQFSAGFQASQTSSVYCVGGGTYPGHQVPGADSGRYICQFISLLANWMGHSAGNIINIHIYPNTSVYLNWLLTTVFVLEINR